MLLIIYRFSVPTWVFQIFSISNMRDLGKGWKKMNIIREEETVSNIIVVMGLGINDRRIILENHGIAFYLLVFNHKT